MYYFNSFIKKPQHLVGENMLTCKEHTKYHKAWGNIFNAWNDYSNGLKTPNQPLKAC